MQKERTATISGGQRVGREGRSTVEGVGAGAGAGVGVGVGVGVGAGAGAGAGAGRVLAVCGGAQAAKEIVKATTATWVAVRPEQGQKDP